MDFGLGKLSQINFQGIEDQLDRVLKPVNPDPMFVDSLKLKLTKTPVVFLETSRQHSWLAVIGIGLVSGALAYWIYKKIKD